MTMPDRIQITHQPRTMTMATIRAEEQKLSAAMKAAREFINRSELLLAYWEAGGPTLTGDGRSGAVRRASMELTRSLSEYRKP
jgi:hypothetical protein